MSPIPTVLKNCYEPSVLSHEGEKEVWSLINVKGLKVIDFGIGDSTKKLVDLGAKVIALDKDVEKLKGYMKQHLQLILCDIANPPFKAATADLAVFHFTLHEIDPSLHEKVITSACRIASRIMVVEPSPNGCASYQRYARVWRDAMHSIGRFEDYKSPSYWEILVKRCCPQITSKKIEHKANVSPKLLMKIVKSNIKEWKRLSVPSAYINEMNKILEYVKENGMRWSDLILIIGECNPVYSELNKE